MANNRRAIVAVEEFAHKIATLPDSMVALSDELADEFLLLIDDGFARQRGPDRKPWKRKKKPDGRPVLSGKSGRLRKFHKIIVTGHGFTLGSPARYRNFIQNGTKFMDARKMYPDKTVLPAMYKRVAIAVAARHLEKHFGRSG